MSVALKYYINLENILALLLLKKEFIEDIYGKEKYG